ncbi:radical SAM protein [Paraburkholderia sp.]|uniref:radical SAM protein n=1 Tax=Paraburkholderia sp. TaxID=1926495 RepID=UPI00286EFE3F|nr:radical SAM protein [Paraburkholderia sp.]
MNFGILLWNTCPAQCAHCAPMSGPRERAHLTNEDIFRVIDSAFHDDLHPKIGLSGGEAFLYFDRLCEIVEYATKKGALISINTSGSWAVTLDKAHERLKIIKSLGASRIIVSADAFHEKFIKFENVLNVVKACKNIHLEIELQFVATKKSMRLHDFLAKFGDELLNVRCREIPCHPTGRAESIPSSELFLQKGIPDGLCPSAILSLSADGHFMPCCNTASHLPTLRVGSISEAPIDVCIRFKSSAIFSVLVSDGPKSLIPAALEAGYEVKPAYVDQCHLCHDIFQQPAVAKAVKAAAIDRVTDRVMKLIENRLDV